MGGNLLGIYCYYGTSDSKPLNTPPYEHCTLIKLLWARVALLNFFVVCEHDLTMDALLENGLSDIRCCYHSNISMQNMPFVVVRNCCRNVTFYYLAAIKLRYCFDLAQLHNT